LLLATLIAACGGTTTPPEQGAGGQPTSTAPAAGGGELGVPTANVEQGGPTSEPTTAAAPTTAAEAPTTAPNQPNQGDINPDYLEFGVVAHLYYTDRERVLQLTQNAGFDWVRQQIYWRDIEDPVNNILAWDEIDRIVETTNAYGRKLLVNVVRSPTAYNATNGLPDDPTTFANFMGLMAERYKGRIVYDDQGDRPRRDRAGGRFFVQRSDEPIDRFGRRGVLPPDVHLQRRRGA
jgi:hypothetical protein